MTTNIVVGYSATSSGRDALHLGTAIARERDARLHLVMIIPADNPFTSSLPYDGNYERIRNRQLQDWLDEADTTVPDDVRCSTHLISHPSVPEGLLEATHRLGGDLIVVGPRPGAVLHRHRLGTMATNLLHTADVPVALAPTGYNHPGPLGHVTAMFGPRRGATDLVGETIATARSRHIPLRLVSLVTQDIADRTAPQDASAVTSGVLHDLQTYASRRLAEDAAELVEDGHATTHIATGRDVPAAMAELSWHPDEIVLVASSRLAAHGRMFLGSTAKKMLRVAPVPVVVIPAGYTAYSGAGDPTTGRLP